MKTVKTVLLLLLVMLLSTSTSNAQLMKKLGDKLERKVNQRLDRKVDRTMDKALDKTEKGIDDSTKKKPKTSEADSNDPVSQETQDFQLETVEASGTYDFEWKYALQMSSKDRDMKMIYYLKPNAKYFGFKPELEQSKSMGGNMFTVMDEGMSKMLMFMDMGDSKIVNAMKMPDNMVENAMEKQDDYTMTELGTKTIMGYQCQGVKIENEEYVMVSYFTVDAPVSFTQIFGGDSKKMPKGFNPKFLKNADKALMMEMKMTHKKKSKHNMTMTCVELKKENFSIDTSDYKSFGGGFGRKN